MTRLKAFFLSALILTASGTALPRAEDALRTYSLPKDPGWIQNSLVYEVYLPAFSPEGKFSGLENKLAKIKKLGADCLLILSVQPARASSEGGPSHPLAVEDSFSVDSEYGTKDGFKNLVEQAHYNMMRVILGWEPGPGALDSEADKMLSWMKEYSLDGYFLVGGKTLPEGFLKELKEKLSAERPGFIVAAADEDFYGTLLEVVSGTAGVSGLHPILEEDAGGISAWPVPFRFIEHFDRPRAAQILEGSSRAAALFLFSLNATPLIYAGQEIGETRAPSPLARKPIDWKAGQRMNSDLKKFYKSAMALRKKHPSLSQGQKFRVTAEGNDSVLVFAATYHQDAVLAAFNFSPAPADVGVQIPSVFYSSKGTLMLENVFGKGKITSNGEGPARLKLSAWGHEIWEMK